MEFLEDFSLVDQPGVVQSLRGPKHYLLDSLFLGPFPLRVLWGSLRSRLLSRLVAHCVITAAAHGGCASGSPSPLGPLSLSPYRYWPGDPHGGPRGVSEGVERTLRAGGLARPPLRAPGLFFPVHVRRQGLCATQGTRWQLPAHSSTCLSALPMASLGVLEILYFLGFFLLFSKTSNL